MAKRKSKKISSQDFLNILGDAETEKRAFNPEKRNPNKYKPQPKSLIEPLKKDILDLALRRMPRFLNRFKRS